MQIRMNVGNSDKVLYFLGRKEKAMKDLSEPLADLGERLVRKIRKRLRGPVLKSRTGRLAGSLTYKEWAKKLVVSAGGKGPAGDDVRYARIQHKGGIIKARNRKFLTIPFPGGPADKRVMLRASDFDNTFVRKGIIFQKQGKTAVPLFILKRKVVIPKRRYMYMEDSDIAYFRKKAKEYIIEGSHR